MTPDRPFNGHEDGAAYWCRPAYLNGNGSPVESVGSGYTFWAPSPGAAGAPQLVDPVTLAEKAVEHMQLSAPRIGMTPMKPGAPLLVGMDAWLWVDNADDHGFGPITRTASAGPTSVTATGKVTKVVWDLGDGTDLTCNNAGTRWSADKGVGPSPTCGHRYLTPSHREGTGAFTVRATAHWQVDWTGAGQSGQMHLTLTGQRQQVVTEVQVLQTA